MNKFTLFSVVVLASLFVMTNAAALDKQKRSGSRLQRFSDRLMVILARIASGSKRGHPFNVFHAARGKRSGDLDIASSIGSDNSIRPRTYTDHPSRTELLAYLEDVLFGGRKTNNINY